ncbi:MAG: hypothetical protein AABX24_03095 [Nanoarchaeota archaeon]
MVIETLETLAKGILGLVNWGITIITVMFLWECYKFITGGSEAGSEVAQKAWKKAKTYIPRTNARAKRVTKKVMNEYIMEGEEEKKLDEIKRTVSTIVADLEVLEQKGVSPLEAAKLVKLVVRLGDKIKDAKKYFRGLNRRTSRAQTGIKRLFDYMKDKGVKDAELVEKVRILEDSILKLHEQTAREIGRVEAEYTTIINYSEMKTLRAESEGKPATTNIASELAALRRTFEKLAGLLESAYQHQTKAKQEMQGVIALTRNVM